MATVRKEIGQLLFLHYSADWRFFHDKMNFHLHNSKKNSIFAAETEDGAAGGAHAEPIPTSSEQAQVRTRRALRFQYIY